MVPSSPKRVANSTNRDSARQRRRSSLMSSSPPRCRSASNRVSAGGSSRFLLDRDDAQPVTPLHGAVVERDAAGQYPQQRRLAAAIASDQADAIALVQGAGRLIEERRQPVGQLGVEQCQQRHRTSKDPARVGSGPAWSRAGRGRRPPAYLDSFLTSHCTSAMN